MSQTAAKVADVPRKTGPVDIITAFIQHRLVQMTKPAGSPTAKALAKRVGLAPSNVTQVINGDLSVGPKNHSKWAKLLGLEEHQMLREAADWWLAEGRAAVRDATAPHDELPPKIANALTLAETFASTTLTQAERTSVLADLGAAREYKDFSDGEIARIILVYLERERRKRTEEKAHDLARRASRDEEKKKEREARRDWRERVQEAGHGEPHGQQAALAAAEKHPLKPPVKAARKKRNAS